MILGRYINVVITLILLSFFVIPVAAHTIGTGGSAWADNSTMDIVTEDLGDGFVKVGVFADNFNDGNYNGWIVYLDFQRCGKKQYQAVIRDKLRTQ